MWENPAITEKEELKGQISESYLRKKNTAKIISPTAPQVREWWRLSEGQTNASGKDQSTATWVCLRWSCEMRCSEISEWWVAQEDEELWKEWRRDVEISLLHSLA